VVLSSITIFVLLLLTIPKVLMYCHSVVYEFSNKDCGSYLQYGAGFPFDTAFDSHFLMGDVRYVIAPVIC